ncbi:hypothetical protein [Catellatospora sp. NPDC049609]|uniref:hypothetical protein n=1 Tax=Catellatospora sp. NPDC049609 TaxID=3155505 RepID=UPI0034404DB6
MTIHLPAIGGYAHAAATLAAHELEPSDIVHVTEYVTAAITPQAVAEGRDVLLDGNIVPISTISVHSFPGSDDTYRVAVTARPGSDGGGTSTSSDGVTGAGAGGVGPLADARSRLSDEGGPA